MNGVPVYFAMPEQQSVANNQETPPARVMVALRFLNDVTAKKMPKVVPMGEWKCEIVDGLKLTPTETNAEMHAHELLVDYFKGDLKADWREQLDVDAYKEIQGRKIEERPSISCPVCIPTNPSPNCMYCDGTGRCLILPGKRRNQ
jgi:hypothetical protein